MRFLLTAALAAALTACSTGETGKADNGTIDTARARESAGDLSGPPAVDTTPRKPTGTSSPSEPQTRGDGRATNPPIHRTNPRDEDVMNPGGSTGDDRSSALLAEVQRLAKSGGCAREGDCQTLPVGRKACGGPRTYVVFCATSTDVAALKRKIAELDALDQAAAARGAVSDCMLALRPTPVLEGGVCRAAP